MIKDFISIPKFIWKDKSNQNERMQRLVKSIGWQLWKRTIAKPLIVRLFNGYRFIAYPNCTSSSHTIYTRIPNYSEITILRQFLNKGTLIDVGASVGLFSLLVADKIKHSLMFEPNPIAAARARENITLNELKFEVYELALSNAVSKIKLEDKGGIDSSNRTITSDMDTSFPTRIVNGTTFDKFIAEKRDIPPIQAIKIDVEGHENAVLEGMTKFIKTKRPNLIMFEYLQRTDFNKTKAFFNSVDYQIYSTNTKNALVPVLNQPKSLQDLFAFPEENQPRKKRCAS